MTLKVRTITVVLACFTGAAAQGSGGSGGGSLACSSTADCDEGSQCTDVDIGLPLDTGTICSGTCACVEASEFVFAVECTSAAADCNAEQHCYDVMAQQKLPHSEATCSADGQCICTDPEDPTPAPEPTPEPTPAVTAPAELTAYWDMGNCGPYGDDQNIGWCPKIGNVRTCPSEKTVSTSVCYSGIANLRSVQGTGNWGSVTIDGCRYGFFAQYACLLTPTPVPTPVLEDPTPEPTPAATASMELTAYWDMGNCGPYGDDHNSDWCPPPQPRVCATQRAVSTSVCRSGQATLMRMQGTGRWGTATIDGCKYGFFAEYACVIEPTPEPTPAPTPEPTPAPTASAELTAYWDMGNCGPYGDDHNSNWCPPPGRVCPTQITVEETVCRSGTALLRKLDGTGGWASFQLDGCRYGYFAQYECLIAPTPEPTPALYDPTPAPTPGATAPAGLTAYWDMDNCGPYGNDHNINWCPGPKPRTCPTQIAVDKATCFSEQATLRSLQGNSQWNSVTIDGCRYGFFAQYECVLVPTPVPTPIDADPTPAPTPKEPTPGPTPEVTASADLTAYWDMGNCGPYGNDVNKDWCPGNPSVCPTQKSVSTSVCRSGQATLMSMKGAGTWGSYTDANGCRYAFYAQFECVISPTPVPTPVSMEPTPEPTPAPTAPAELTSYWDVGNCGPYGDDHHISWCPKIGNTRTCPSEISVSTSVCYSGKAELSDVKGSGRWGSYTADDGCRYGYFAQYSCYMAPTPVPTPAPTPEPTPAPTASSDLTAYWDMGDCGPYGNDNNIQWCPKAPGSNQRVCPTQVSVSTSVCYSGVAVLRKIDGEGYWASYTDTDGCRYGFFAQYACLTVPTPAPEPTPEPTPEPEPALDPTPVPTPAATASADLTAYWDMGVCGPYGNDVNIAWCPKPPGSNQRICPSEVTVSTSVCSSGTATMYRMQGTGNWGSVTLDGCRYGFFAEYACTEEARRLAQTALDSDAAYPNAHYAVVTALLGSSGLLVAAVLYSLHRKQSSAKGAASGAKQVKETSAKRRLSKNAYTTITVGELPEDDYSTAEASLDQIVDPVTASPEKGVSYISACSPPMAKSV